MQYFCTYAGMLKLVYGIHLCLAQTMFKLYFVCELSMRIILPILLNCILEAYIDESQYDLMVLAYIYYSLPFFSTQVCICGQCM